MPVPFRADAFTLTEDGVGIFVTTDLNPDITGFDAPKGSLLLCPGKLWIKTDTTTTAWGQSSSSVSQSLSFASTTINYTLSDKVLILADTTTSPITIFLPLANTMTNRMFHIKWQKGSRKNPVTILPTTGELLEGFASQIMGEIGDSLEIFSTGTEWIII